MLTDVIREHTVGFLGGVVVLTMAGAACGQSSAEQEPRLQRPRYSVLRYNEDWSVLRDVESSQRLDFWDPIKHIPLTDDGDVWVSFGGHARMRFEGWSGFGFGAADPDDDEFVLWRLLLHADLHIGENVRIFTEGKTAWSTDRDLSGGKRTIDVDALDLEQLFVDVTIPINGGSSLVIRPGRQTFLFGKQRLVSPLPWVNTFRRWDGISAIFRSGEWTIHGFWSQFVPVQKYEFNDTDDATKFFGVYATGHVPGTEIGLDLYYLGLDRAFASFNGTSGDEERHTLGGRLFGAFGDSGFEYDLEGAYQFGEVGAGDVNAYMLGAEIAYKHASWWGAPRFSLGLELGSGDESPGGDVETFNQLFPLGHAYLGYIDTVGRQNVIDLTPAVSFSPFKKTTVGVAGHFFWRADDADALYNAGGGVVRPGGGAGASYVGAELDITLRHRFDTHTTGLLGYSHFFAGSFIEDTGPGDDIDFVYVQMQYTF